jgi:hypothetical protein
MIGKVRIWDQNLFLSYLSQSLSHASALDDLVQHLYVWSCFPLTFIQSIIRLHSCLSKPVLTRSFITEQLSLLLAQPRSYEYHCYHR